MISLACFVYSFKDCFTVLLILHKSKLLVLVILNTMIGYNILHQKMFMSQKEHLLFLKLVSQHLIQYNLKLQLLMEVITTR